MKILEQYTETEIRIKHNHILVDSKHKQITDELHKYFGTPYTRTLDSSNNICGSSWKLLFKTTHDLSTLLNGIMVIIMNNRCTPAIY